MSGKFRISRTQVEQLAFICGVRHPDTGLWVEIEVPFGRLNIQMKHAAMMAIRKLAENPHGVPTVLKEE